MLDLALACCGLVLAVWVVIGMAIVLTITERVKEEGL